MKKSLTREEYLQLLGLITLGQTWQKRLDDVRDAAMVLLETDDESGHVSDVIYGERDITWLLSSLEIEVPAVFPAQCGEQEKP